MVTNWARHLIDVADFMNGTCHTGPVHIEGKGTFPELGVLWDTITDFEVHYHYANGVRLGYKIGVLYLRVEGGGGWLQAGWHSPGCLRAHDRSILNPEFRDTDTLVPTRSDKQDFIDAIVNSSEVMLDAGAGHWVNSQYPCSASPPRLSNGTPKPKKSPTTRKPPPT